MTSSISSGLKLCKLLTVVSAAAMCGYWSGGVVTDVVLTKSRAESRTDRSLIGATLRFTEDDISLKQRTLMVVTRSGCRYCTESMPFYQRLTREAENVGVPIVFATSEPLTDNADYLRSSGLASAGPLNPISTVNVGLAVRGTPTIVLVENNTIKEYWLGKLSTAEEQAVIAAVQGIAK